MADAIPFTKDLSFEYGECDRISPLIRRVIAENPGPFTYTGSGTYIIGEGDVAVIDPGPEDAAHTEALLRAISGERITHIFVTHAHRDHCGGVPALKAATGAPILAFGAHGRPADGDAPAMEEGVDYGFTPDTTLSHGEVVKGPGWTLEAVHTPGHVSNHLCFALQEEKALFSGDHLMGWATTVILPPDGDMGDYMNSLALLLERDETIYYPTHGGPIENPKRFTRAVIAHRKMRDGQILNALASGKSTIPDLVDTMYVGLDPRLKPAAAMSVYAHMLQLVKTGAVVCDGQLDINAAFSKS
ncbi:MAG: MBL fold metallo-hydrolase [Pseudomonadota bacterium]